MQFVGKKWAKNGEVERRKNAPFTANVDESRETFIATRHLWCRGLLWRLCCCPYIPICVRSRWTDGLRNVVSKTHVGTVMKVGGGIIPMRIVEGVPKLVDFHQLVFLQCLL